MYFKISYWEPSKKKNHFSVWLSRRVCFNCRDWPSASPSQMTTSTSLTSPAQSGPGGGERPTRTGTGREAPGCRRGPPRGWRGASGGAPAPGLACAVCRGAAGGAGAAGWGAHTPRAVRFLPCRFVWNGVSHTVWKYKKSDDPLRAAISIWENLFPITSKHKHADGKIAGRRCDFRVTVRWAPQSPCFTRTAASAPCSAVCGFCRPVSGSGLAVLLLFDVPS